MDGFVFVNKPAGPSSFAIIRQMKPLVGRSQIGHAGTLDPAASGLLIVAVGKATRLIEFLPMEPKCYAFTLHFGAETDTLDNEGIVVQSGGRIPARIEIESALSRFTGAIDQEPPRFSAVKVDGERAYKRARNRENFALKPRRVTVDSLTLENFDSVTGIASMTVCCSSGTYVRSLARDIARALDAYGFASGIRRTAIGSFSLDDAKELDDVTASFPSCLVSIDEAFRTCTRITITEAQKDKLSCGADIPLDISSDVGQPVFAFAFERQHAIAAVLEKKENGLYHPMKVFL